MNKDQQQDKEFVQSILEEVRGKEPEDMHDSELPFNELFK